MLSCELYSCFFGGAFLYSLCRCKSFLSAAEEQRLEKPRGHKGGTLEGGRRRGLGLWPCTPRKGLSGELGGAYAENIRLSCTFYCFRTLISQYSRFLQAKPYTIVSVEKVLYKELLDAAMLFDIDKDFLDLLKLKLNSFNIAHKNVKRGPLPGSKVLFPIGGRKVIFNLNLNTVVESK